MVKKVQICFAGNANLQVVESQLRTIKLENPEFEFYSCFLPRHIVIERGWQPDIDDLFIRVLGDGVMNYPTENATSYDDCMAQLEAISRNLAVSLDYMYVLDSGIATGVQSGISVFTSKKVIMM